MVLFNLERNLFLKLQEDLKSKGILISGREKVRLVTHLDISAEDVITTVSTFKDHFS
jgi:threonine aldolase